MFAMGIFTGHFIRPSYCKVRALYRAWSIVVNLEIKGNGQFNEICK